MRKLRLRVRYGRSLLTIALLSFVTSAGAGGRPVAAATEKARLRVSFLRNGVPWPATLIVADGSLRKVFRNVTRIDAAVPRRATYTVLADTVGTGRVTFKDVIPVLELPAAGRDLVVHLPAGGLEAFSPAVLVEDAPASVSVRSQVLGVPDSGRPFTLSTTAEGRPGSTTMLDTIIEPIDRQVGYLCQSPCPHLYPRALPVDCSTYCYTCSTTAVLQAGHWKENFNLCSLTVETDGSAAPVESVLRRLPAGQGGVGLAVALRRDGALVPVLARLRSLASTAEWVLRPPFTKRSYPDFVVPVGRYVYALTVPDPGAPGGSFTHALPLAVEDRRIRTVLLDLPQIATLDPFDVRVLGDSRLGLALSRARLVVTGPRSVRVVANLEGSRDDVGWVTVVLPGAATVVAVRLVDGAGPALDFTVTGDTRVRLLTVAVGPGRTRFDVEFEDRS